MFSNCLFVYGLWVVNVSVCSASCEFVLLVEMDREAIGYWTLFIEGVFLLHTFIYEFFSITNK